MKWRHTKPTSPGHDELRVTCKFAWLPVTINEYTVWLEYYFVTERFYQPMSGSPGWWRIVKTEFAYFYD